MNSSHFRDNSRTFRVRYFQKLACTSQQKIICIRCAWLSCVESSRVAHTGSFLLCVYIIGVGTFLHEKPIDDQLCSFVMYHIFPAWLSLLCRLVSLVLRVSADIKGGSVAGAQFRWKLQEERQAHISHADILLHMLCNKKIPRRIFIT